MAFTKIKHLWAKPKINRLEFLVYVLPFGWADAYIGNSLAKSDISASRLVEISYDIYWIFLMRSRVRDMGQSSKWWTIYFMLIVWMLWASTIFISVKIGLTEDAGIGLSMIPFIGPSLYLFIAPGNKTNEKELPEIKLDGPESFVPPESWGRSSITRLKQKLLKTVALVMGFMGYACVLILGFFWTIGGLSGAVLSALNDHLLGVVLSIFIPGYGAIVTMTALYHWIFG